jgi:hypothetical protein
MRTVALAVALLLAPTAADAALMKFCILHTGNFRDSGVAGEDHWTDQWNAVPAAPKLARGARVMVLTNGQYVWNGNLGDGFGAGDYGTGCTDWFVAPIANAVYWINVGTLGLVNGWNVSVKNRLTTATLFNSFFYQNVSGAGQRNVVLTMPANTGAEDDDWDLYNTYQAASWTLFRHGGGMECTQNLDIMVGDTAPPQEADCDGGPCNCSACYKSRPADLLCPNGAPLGKVWIENQYQDRKFQVSHEIGHALFWRYTGKNANVCDYYDPDDHFDDVLCGPDDAFHSWHTIEWAGCAQYEGFAQFYAADIWNNHDQEDCRYKSYTPGPGAPPVSGPRVNCELGTPDPDPAPGTLLPTAYMENACGALDSELPSHGTEVDWVRVYWNVHTEGGAARPDFWDMMHWMDVADDWSAFNTYTKLDEAADVIQGQIRSNWNAAVNADNAEGHGIDWPGP